MSWGEVFKINSNMKVPLNKQLRNIELYRSWLFEASATFTPPVDGVYKVTCIGAGGAGKNSKGGGAGGVVVGLLKLQSSSSYAITVSKNSSFSNLITATAGSDGTSSSGGAGGSGSGGTVYNGNAGESKGGSVGIFIAGAMKDSADADYPGGMGLYVGHSKVLSGNSSSYTNYSASSGGGCGAGGGSYYANSNKNSYLTTSGGDAAVLITLIEEGGEL